MKYTVTNEIDPVTLEIMWRRLITIMDETDKTVIRTAFSTIVGESGDFACILMDDRGYGLAQSSFSTTLFTVTIPRTTRFCIETIGRDNIREGDVYITNDPWQGSGHLPDVTVVTPVFHRGRLAGFIGTCAHLPDIGGHRGYFNASEVYEEGLQIPPCRIQREGAPNDEIVRFIETNVRVPHLVIGDLRGIVSAGYVGSKRLQEFMDDYGLAHLRDVADNILHRSESAVRQVIRDVADGVYRHALDADAFADPIHIEVAIDVRGDGMGIDLTGSSPQVAYGATNCTLNATMGDVLVCMKSLLAPKIPNNEGLFAPLAVSAPLGSVFNCTYPAAVQARSVAIVHLHDAIYGALEHAMADRVHAGASTFWALHAAGRGPDGKPYKTHLIPDGGIGGCADKDGMNTIRFPGNGSMAPAEVFENKAPMIMERKEFATDSAGPGRFRGGLGQDIHIRATQEVEVTIRPNNVKFAAPGLAGGLDAPAGEYLINGKRPPLAPVKVKAGDLIELRLPGGGGYGDPTERVTALVERDVAYGFVSPGEAQARYGKRIAADSGGVAPSTAATKKVGT